MQRPRTRRMAPAAAMLLSLAAGLWIVGDGSAASAQMFGARRPLGLSATTTDTSTTVGQVQGNERFLRENRRRAGTFVGNDPRQRQGFVGQTSVQTGRVRAAAEMARVLMAPSVRQEAASSVNRMTGMYEPRLAVAFDVDRPTDAQITEQTVLQLQLIHAFLSATRIEVSVAAGTATLRGEVASERDRSLAERLILFEPGIAAVRNELRVAPTPPSGAPTPPDSPPPATPSTNPQSPPPTPPAPKL